MRLLSYLLLDGHASPMYKALIDTNLGSEFSANTGYDSSTRYKKNRIDKKERTNALIC